MERQQRKKSQKSLCANFNEELQASSEEFNKHITTKKKTTMCKTSPNPTTRVAKTRSTTPQQQHFNNGGKLRIALTK